jgi:hypothetical protein
LGPEAKLYEFPEIYQRAIQGRLEYDEMVKAYKWYRVSLNVNSVKKSPTMFSRRVFELLASGTPVVSAFSKGIVELLGNEIVQLTNSESETMAHLERLLCDKRYWAEVSLKGLREVFSKHTCAQRLAEICQELDLPFAGQRLPVVTVVADISTDEHVKRLIWTLARQTYRQFNLLLAADETITNCEFQAISAALPDVKVHRLYGSPKIYDCVAEQANGDYLWLLNLDHYYGDHFLQDAITTTLYSDADVIGKRTYYRCGSDGSELALIQPGHDFKFTTGLSPGSIVAKRGKLSPDQWKALTANVFLAGPDLRCVSIDRFNYIEHGGDVSGLNAKDGRHPLAGALG